MAHIDIRHPHSLSLEQVRTKAQKLGDAYHLACHWEGNVLHFERPGLTGYMEMDGQEVRITTTLGMSLRPMKSAIELRMREYLSKVLTE